MSNINRCSNRMPAWRIPECGWTNLMHFGRFFLSKRFCIKQHAYWEMTLHNYNQDPVVQSIVSLTISLRHKFVKQISAKVTNTLLFFVEKM